MRFVTASTAMLAAILLPVSSTCAMRVPSTGASARAIPITLSPATDVTASTDAWRFDGRWNVVVFCPASDDTPASAFRFMAGVKDGVLHGERGSGNRGSMVLDGTIQPDGLSRLDASGIVNDADEALGQARRETTYAYHVAARFEGSHGLGARIEGRVCHLNFTRTPG